MPLIEPWARLASREVDARPVATVRILVGIAALLRALEAGRLLRLWLPDTVVRMPMADWYPVFPPEVLFLLVGVWGGAAAAFAAGWRTRGSGTVLVLVMAYILFLDQQTYSNHLYLLVLVVGLLAWADSGACVSLDAWLRRGRERVAAWPVFLLKAQVSIVYLFAALTKLNGEYLSGRALGQQLNPEFWAAIPKALQGPALSMGLAVASLGVELFLAAGLWGRRTRLAAIVVGVAFHFGLVAIILPAVSLQIFVFTLLMLALYPLFFDPPGRRR